MFAIGNYSWLTMLMLGIFSIVPVIFFFGRVFTKHGRESLRANPLIFLYFLIMPAYAYFFWTNPQLIHDYLGLNKTYQEMLYGALCLIPFFQKDIVN